jgi:hypothetical protein
VSGAVSDTAPQPLRSQHDPVEVDRMDRITLLAAARRRLNLNEVGADEHLVAALERVVLAALVLETNTRPATRRVMVEVRELDDALQALGVHILERM